jgi:hypothetical protein
MKVRHKGKIERLRGRFCRYSRTRTRRMGGSMQRLGNQGPSRLVRLCQTIFFKKIMKLRTEKTLQIPMISGDFQSIPITFLKIFNHRSRSRGTDKHRWEIRWEIARDPCGRGQALKVPAVQSPGRTGQQRRMCLRQGFGRQGAGEVGRQSMTFNDRIKITKTGTDPVEIHVCFT